MLQVGTRLNRGLSLLVCLALALAGCTNYRMSLDPIEFDDPAAGTTEEESETYREPPRPLFRQQELEEPPVEGTLDGWVRLRFAVSETGAVEDIEVLESSDFRLEGPAVRLVSDWTYTPGTIDGTPAAFARQEAYVTFFEEPNVIDTPEEYFLIGAAIFVVFVTLTALTLALGGDSTTVAGAGAD
jgi:TonB family protein